MRSVVVATACTFLAILAGSALAQESETHQAREALRESTHEAVDAALREEGDAQHDEHGAHGEGHHAVDTNPLTTDPDLAIYTAIIFLILFFVLSKFAWRPIAEGLDRRERSIAEQIEAAARTNDDAQRLLAEYEQRLAKAHDEVREMVEEARRDATHTTQEIVAKAHTEAEAIKDRALRDIDIAKGAALDELARTSGRLAIDLAGRILHTELDAGRHQHMIQEALERIPAGNGHN